MKMMFQPILCNLNANKRRNIPLGTLSNRRIALLVPPRMPPIPAHALLRGDSVGEPEGFVVGFSNISSLFICISHQKHGCWWNPC